MDLKNKRILITAGPTWVAIDKVRVISNIATGTTGVLLAKSLRQQGAKVTLILADSCGYCLDKTIKIRRYSFFDQLQSVLTQEIKTTRYDVIIHSAAVSDYRPQKTLNIKIDSNLDTFNIKMVRTPKIIDTIRKYAPNAVLIGFKFEPTATKNRLIQEAWKLITHAKLDIAVANIIKGKNYRAYIVTKDSTSAAFGSKEELVKNLTQYLRS